MIKPDNDHCDGCGSGEARLLLVLSADDDVQVLCERCAKRSEAWIFCPLDGPEGGK